MSLDVRVQVLLVVCLASMTAPARARASTQAAIIVNSITATASVVIPGQSGVGVQVGVKNTSQAGVATWTRLQSDTGSPGTTQPPQRSDHGLAFDSNRNVTVLFGGANSRGFAINDTWEWNGTAWTQRQSDTPTPGTNQPPRRSDGAVAYDSVRHRVVLFGGASFFSRFNDTWGWNRTSWTQIQSNTATGGTTQPSQRVSAAR